MRKNKIFAPKLLKSFFSKGIIEIEDFGDISLKQHVENSKKKYDIYKWIIRNLIKIQKIRIQKIIYFQKKYKINLKYYDCYALHKESDLFFNWYLPGVIGKIGSILGNHNVNIAEYLLSRTKYSNNAYGIVKLDNLIGVKILNSLEELDEVTEIKQINIE